MRRAVQPRLHHDFDRRLAAGDVLPDFQVPVTPFLDAFRLIGAVAPFVADMVMLGHVARMIARGLHELGIGSERWKLGLGPHTVVGFDQGREVDA